MDYAYKEPKPQKRILGIRPHIFKMWATIAFISGLIFMFLFGNRGIWKILILNQQIHEKLERIDSLEAVKNEIKPHIIGLKKGDSLAIETAARDENIRMVYEGEKIYIVKEIKDNR